MDSIVDFYLELKKEYEKYRKNLNYYLKNNKRRTVRGDYEPLSDIDVAIILKRKVKDFNRAEFGVRISRKIEFLHPFKIHIITEDIWKSWYSKFIKKDFVEV